MIYTELKDFYNGKNVLITGNTGFKGTWLSKVLCMLGANVYGYALEAPNLCIYNLVNAKNWTNSFIGDIRDFNDLKRAFDSVKPEYVFHLAAQPIVRQSYLEPRETYEVNVIGTVNILECIRLSSYVKGFLNVTTDKVYENNDLENHPFQEFEKLDGFDPYSNSKSCSELVTHSYKKSFFSAVDENIPAISTARAGNVIGGGDFSVDRIIPDCVRSAVEGKVIGIRNPYSIRPYQHVLDPIYVYLLIMMKQCKERSLSDYYNVGPDEEDCISTGQLADRFSKEWGNDVKWKSLCLENEPHEASFLKLDCSNLKSKFDWNSKWHIEKSVEKTVQWYKAWLNKNNCEKVTENQIEEFFEI